MVLTLSPTPLPQVGEGSNIDRASRDEYWLLDSRLLLAGMTAVFLDVVVEKSNVAVGKRSFMRFGEERRRRRLRCAIPSHGFLWMDIKKHFYLIEASLNANASTSPPSFPRRRESREMIAETGVTFFYGLTFY